MQSIRPPAVAGSFYPDNPHELRAMLAEYLEQAEPSVTAPKAMIVPHAGYIYSGVCAAKAYARLAPKHAMIKRVVLLGPSHHVAFTGLALSRSCVIISGCYFMHIPKLFLLPV
jgi:AmmeMemoRadiSam system protein B